MKKLVAVCCLMGMGSGIGIAQKLPDTGSISIEVQTNPFDDYGKTSVLDGVKFRYFMNEKHALRLNAGFGTNKDRYSFENSMEKATYESSFNARETYFTVSLGYEYHMVMGNRFDLYAGGEAGFVRHFAKTEGEVMLDGQWHSVSVSNAYIEQENITSAGVVDLRNIDSDERAKAGFRVAALIGGDCYLYKGLYIGAEVSISINSLKMKEMKNTLTSPVTGGEITQWDKQEQRKTDCSVRIDPCVRVGWTF